MVVCLELGADLHMAQLMPLPLTVSHFSKIQIGFTFLVPTHLGSPGKRAIERCVCVCCEECIAKLPAILPVSFEVCCVVMRCSFSCHRQPITTYWLCGIPSSKFS